MRRLRLFLTAPRLVLLALVVAALVLRWQFVDFASGDYRAFLDRWYAFIEQNGGFAALQDASFSNYNTPYLVLLAVLTYLPVPEMVAIKALSVVFAVVLAVFAHKIIAVLRPGSRWLPVAAFGVTLLLPTVVMNSSVWAQCDAIYVSFCLGSLSFLIRRRPWLACVFFGIAFAFKLQAIFFLPVLVVVLIVNRQRVRALVGALVAFLACLVPAMIAGRSLVSQLSVYPTQIANPSGAVAGGGVRGGRGFPGGGPGGGFSRGGGGGGGFGDTSASSFTNNAPTPYAWLPSGASELWKYAGLAVCVAVALAFGIWLLRRRRALSGSEILLVAAAATLIVPLLLPEMHERYFYLAEVLTVLAAFVDRRFIAVAAGIQIASVSTYLSYLDVSSLNGAELMPLRLAALIALFAAVGAAAILIHRLSRPGDRESVSRAGQNREHVVEPVGADPGGARRDPVAQRQT